MYLQIHKRILPKYKYNFNKNLLHYIKLKDIKVYLNELINYFIFILIPLIGPIIQSSKMCPKMQNTPNVYEELNKVVLYWFCFVYRDKDFIIMDSKITQHKIYQQRLFQSLAFLLNIKYQCKVFLC